MMPAPAPTPDQPTRSGVLLRVGIFAFLEIAGMVVFATLMFPVAGYFVSAALSTFAAAAVANTIALRVYERGTLADVGLGWSAGSARNLAIGFIGGAGGVLLAVIPAVVIGVARWKPAEDWDGSLASVLFVVIVLLFGAVGEELLFRGYGFQVLLASMGEYATILPVSVLFGLAHSNNQSATVLGIVNTTGWGVLLALAFLRSRDLWFPIGIHYGWNILLALLGVNLSGFTMRVTGYSLDWRIGEIWSGGSYGLEGGVITSLVLVVLFAGLSRAPVRRQVAFLYRPEDKEV